MRNPVLLGEIARWFNDVQRRRAKGFCGHRSSELDTDKTMLEPDFDPAPTAVQIGRCGYPMPCLAAAKTPPANCCGGPNRSGAACFSGSVLARYITGRKSQSRFPSSQRSQGSKHENANCSTSDFDLLVCSSAGLAPGRRQRVVSGPAGTVAAARQTIALGKHPRR